MCHVACDLCSDEVVIDEELDCIPTPNIILLVIEISSGIVILGMLLLIVWKIYAFIADKIEYQKFQDEKNKVRWKDNKSPIYRDPTTKYKNPIYRPRVLTVSKGKRLQSKGK